MTPRPPEGDWLGSQYLRFERHGSLAHCVVDRLEKRNALTPAMYFGIRHAVHVVNTDPALAGLLITGTGDVFVPGGDMSGTYDDFWDGLGSLGMDVTPFDTIRHSAKPVVTAVNGLAFGGGMMIAMLSDVAVASEHATFRAPEIFRGIADTHYSQILPQQVGIARARDLLLTGRTLDAATACEWGLVTRVVAHDDLMREATQVLTECCWGAPAARREVKRAINLQYGLYDRMAMEASLAGTEYIEGYTAFAERRPPSWIAEDIRPEGRVK
jgi:enoyl-CoA hydratase/carnithine racemase